MLFIAHFLVKSGVARTEAAADGVWVGMSGNYQHSQKRSNFHGHPLFGYF